MYLSVAIGVGLFSTEWPTIASKVQASEMRLVLLIFVSAKVVRLALIWLTARKRQNWARWVLLVLVLLGLPQFLRTLGPLLAAHPLLWAVRIGQFALDIVAFVLIFTRRFARVVQSNSRSDGEYQDRIANLIAIRNLEWL